MADIGSLIIRIGADASGLQKAFSDLGGSAKQFQRGVEQIGKFAATAFLGAATAAVAMTIAAGKQAEQLEQLSNVTGINTDKLQEYDVALARAGMDGQDLALVMKNVANSLEQARQGTGTAGDRFRQLGINIRTVTSTDDLIRKIVASSGNFANGLQKAALMSDLLGRGWQTIIRTFPGGTKALNEMAAASKALGETMSSNQIAVLAKMDDSIDDLMTAVKRFGQQLGVFLAPTIEMVTKLLTDLAAFGSRAFVTLGTETDVFATKLLHTGLQVQELFKTLFSENVFSGDAWTQTLANVKLIGAEADKQAAHIRAAAAAARTPAANDTRAQLPELVNTQQESTRQQAVVDASLRRFQGLAQGKEAIAQAELANYMAVLDQEQAFGIKTDQETASARQRALASMDAVTVSSLTSQLAGYRRFMVAKNALFTDDEKGQAERLKFAEDAAREEAQLINKISVAQINADTTRIQSGLQVKTFWIQQLQDIAAANAFATAQIIGTWTSGVANSIVNGGDFAKAAWKSTELAIVQGALNAAVQWGAKQALMVIQTLTASATIEEINAAKNSAIIAGDTAAASITVSVWAAAATSISGFFAATIASFEAMVGTMVATVTAVGEFIMGVLAAIAEALTDTIFGIPWAGAIVVGIALIAAALAATGNLGFKEGGIGEFGAGTPAMLHGPEAIIPLNSRGASFLQDAFGGGSHQPIHTHVYLNGREIARAVSDDLPGALRAMGSL